MYNILLLTLGSGLGTFSLQLYIMNPISIAACNVTQD